MSEAPTTTTTTIPLMENLMNYYCLHWRLTKHWELQAWEPRGTPSFRYFNSGAAAAPDNLGSRSGSTVGRGSGSSYFGPDPEPSQDRRIRVPQKVTAQPFRSRCAEKLPFYHLFPYSFIPSSHHISLRPALLTNHLFRRSALSVLLILSEPRGVVPFSRVLCTVSLHAF